MARIMTFDFIQIKANALLCFFGYLGTGRGIRLCSKRENLLTYRFADLLVVLLEKLSINHSHRLTTTL